MKMIIRIPAEVYLYPPLVLATFCLNKSCLYVSMYKREVLQNRMCSFLFINSPDCLKYRKH